ncbi:DNA polymerase III subunit beta family protein [Arthrobacter tecti]
MDNDADRLMSIGTFAAATGLTASALRFYDDTGVLAPVEVDPRNGYRLYAEEQLGRAELIFLLREAQLPLSVMKAVLDDSADESSLVLSKHLDEISFEALRAMSAARSALNLLSGGVPGLVAMLPGYELARAIGQVRVSAAASGQFHAIGISTASHALNLVATDRHRLSWRTLRLASPTVQSSTVHVSLESAQQLLPWISDRAAVELLADAGDVSVRCMETGEQRSLAVVEGDFPDYGAVVHGLPAAVARAVVPRRALLSVVEERSGTYPLMIAENGISVGPGEGSEQLAALTWGPPLRQWFDMTLLRPVMESAVGPDVVLEMAGDHGPLRVRSADTSDLLSVLMPVRPASAVREVE